MSYNLEEKIKALVDVVGEVTVYRQGYGHNYGVEYESWDGGHKVRAPGNTVDEAVSRLLLSDEFKAEIEAQKDATPEDE